MQAGQPELRVYEVPTGELVPYAGNAKEHPDWQVGQIVASIERFGFLDPVGVWHDPEGRPVIVEGHGRVMAAKELGMPTVPCVALDHLDDEGRRAYALAHNQLTMNSGWDDLALSDELADLADMDMGDFGFDVGGDAADAADVAEVEVPEDVPTVCERGQVWRLGRHRLMCGDSTSAEDVDRLMDGERADVCFTSPPYNMNVQTGWETAPVVAMNAGRAYNECDDNLTDDDYAEMLRASLDNALSVCDDAMFNVGILAGSKRGVAEMVASRVGNLCDVVVWNKKQSMPHGMESQRGMLSHRCEFVFCFNQTGTRSFTHPQWEKGTGINRIDTCNASSNDYADEHSATFPVEFAAEVVRNFTDSSVLDLFGGTGTTLVAAEQLGRTCYMMELDPHYCDVIVARWEELTGGKAERVE